MVAAPKLLGHQEQWQSFVQAVRLGRPHHAWLLHGPKGVGKATFARQATACLMAGALTGSDADPGAAFETPQGRLVLQNAHPDVTWLSTPPAKTKRAQEQLPVADVRSGTAKVYSTASYGGWRVLAIDSLDAVRSEGANALLKTLEEPPARTLIFLIAHRLGAVLPTLRSRCRLLPFSPLDDDTMQRFAQSQDTIQLPEHAAALRIARGLPGSYLSLIENPDILEAIEQFNVLAGQPDRHVERLDFAARVDALSAAEAALFRLALDAWFADQIAARSAQGDNGQRARHALAQAWQSFSQASNLRTSINLDLQEQFMGLFGRLDSAAQPNEAMVSHL
ncbi:MAG: AAA family ATPase [Pseudomonadota bacterium]